MGRNTRTISIEIEISVSGTVSLVVFGCFGIVFRLFRLFRLWLFRDCFGGGEKQPRNSHLSHCISSSQAMQLAATSSRRKVFMSVRALTALPLRSIRPRALHS